MSSLTVGWLFDIVRKKAIDEGETDYDDVDLISLYNITLRLIVSLVPRAYPLTQAVQMVSGVMQSIPTKGMRLIDVPKNMGTDGKTQGESIRESDLNAMRALVPDWAEETAATKIEHFIRIPNMDASFYVYPPSDGTGYIQQVFSAVPPTVVYDAADAWKSERIPLSDEFVPALPDGILFNAYDDDTDIPGTAARAQIYYNRMLKLLGLKSPEMKRERQWQQPSQIG